MVFREFPYLGFVFCILEVKYQKQRIQNFLRDNGLFFIIEIIWNKEFFYIYVLCLTRCISSLCLITATTMQRRKYVK